MKNNNDARELAPLLAAVEEELAAYYNFSPQAAVNSHLISKDELRAALGAAAEAEPEWQARAGVWLVGDTRAEGGGDVFVGVNFSDDLQAAVLKSDPLDHLDNHNLDAFCILIEEVSHFHLLLNRMSEGRPVARAELELQGELDKLLICARLLRRQSGDEHVLQLARTLYDTAKIVAADQEAYWLATKYAARFWFARENIAGPDAVDVRARLKALYLCDWTKKRAAFEGANLDSLAA